jgi:hypothetical protein
MPPQRLEGVPQAVEGIRETRVQLHCLPQQSQRFVQPALLAADGSEAVMRPEMPGTLADHRIQQRSRFVNPAGGLHLRCFPNLQFHHRAPTRRLSKAFQSDSSFI